jgi:hypothetical protein
MGTGTSPTDVPPHQSSRPNFYYIWSYLFYNFSEASNELNFTKLSQYENYEVTIAHDHFSQVLE